MLSVVMGVAYGGVAALGLVLERAAHEALGWPLAVAGDPDSNPFADAGPATLVLSLALMGVAGHLSGLLAHVAYYARGWVVGTLLLPLTLAPIFLVGAGSLPTGQWTLITVDLPVAGAAALAVAVLAAAAVAVHLLTRRIAIRGGLT